MTKRSNLPRRALATVLAVCAHLAALLALGWRIPKMAEERQADILPPIEVALVRPPKPVQPAAPSPARAARARPPQSAPPAPSPNPLPPVLTQPAPTAPPAVAPPGSENFRSALRGLVGCSDPEVYHLNREERAACDQRLAAAKPGPAVPRYTAEEVAAFNTNKESIFTRKPHNECLPHIGNLPAASAAARSSSAATTAIGIACEWDFW